MTRHDVPKLALTAVTVLAAACGAPPEPPPPNVILVSLDTVRRDAVGVYRGFGESPTPEIDRLAESCVRFDRAWAPVPFTLSSHMSIFTGLHPEAHAVWKSTHTLDPGISTVAELASRAGYHNLGLVSNIWMKGVFGFDRGFDHYERISYGLTYAERINTRLFELLDATGADDERPLFVFLHYIDAHSDYQKEGVNSLPYYSSPEQLDALGLTATGTELCDDEGNCSTGFLTAANRSGRAVDAATIDLISELYLGGVRFLDRHIGELVRGLDERGLLETSVLIVTSDHGEEFREHGRFVHSQPYVESLAVPLLVRFPGGAHGGMVIDDPVELADLMPSILGVMGVPPPDHVPARDVFSPITNGGGAPAPFILGVDKIRHRRFALRDRRHTLIVDLSTGKRELYDRSTDPAEHNDIIAGDPGTAAELEAVLRSAVNAQRKLGKSFRTGAPPPAEEALSDLEKEQLRAIGYLE